MRAAFLLKKDFVTDFVTDQWVGRLAKILA